MLYTFGAWATWYTLSRRNDGARWMGRVLMLRPSSPCSSESPSTRRASWFDLGTFGDVGTVSTFLIMVLPVFLLFALRSKPHSAARSARSSWQPVASSPASDLNRRFALAAAAEITIFALFSMRYWDSRFRAASMLAVGAIVATLAMIQVLTASESRIALATPGTGVWEFTSGDPRGELWHFAVRQIAEHPWIGAGLGKLSSRHDFITQFGDPMLLHSHNMFLNRALETGLPGLLAFLLLLGQVALAFRRVARSADPSIAAIGAAGLALVVGVVVKNLTDDFMVKQSALLFWSLVGAGLGGAAAREEAMRAALSTTRSASPVRAIY